MKGYPSLTQGQVNNKSKNPHTRARKQEGNGVNVARSNCVLVYTTQVNITNWPHAFVCHFLPSTIANTPPKIGFTVGNMFS